MKEMRYTKLFGALLLFLVACNPSELDPSGPREGDRPVVEVGLALDVASLEPGMPGTKTDYEPDLDGGVSLSEVKSILLLQFEWQDEDYHNAKLVGQQQFFDHWPLNVGENFALVSSSAKNTVFVVANVPGPLPTITVGTTLGSFMSNQNNSLIEALDDVDGGGIWYVPGGGPDRYLRMSGACEQTGIAPDDHLSVTLKRNCAKVVINVRNAAYDKTGDDRISIGYVQLRDYNRKYYYATNAEYFEDAYSLTYPFRADCAEEAFPAVGNEDGSVQQFVYYVPANLRGVTGSSAQYMKNFGAPSGATRFCLYAEYGTSSPKPINYTYYLGANLTNDFNLAPNKKYTYNITVSGKGNPSFDYRVEDQGDITFAQDANCYMLQPPSRSGAWLNYSVPVRRAAVFWNTTDTNMGIYAAGGGETAYKLEEDTEWTAWFVWNEIRDGAGNQVSAGDLLVDASLDDFQDPDITGKVSATYNKYVVTGKGFNPYYSGAPVAGHDPYVRIKVQSGMRGSALLALKKKSGTTNKDILWTWHIWVTDYDPDVSMTAADGTYIYPAVNGNLHRYYGADWNKDAYKQAFIMDRNLGARYSESANVRDNQGYYYQYGRKDPFHWGASIVAYNNTGEPLGSDDRRINSRYVIHQPLIFIGKNGPANDWTSDRDELTDNQHWLWKDPKFNTHGADNCEPEKSVYDPCPPGWRVPPFNVYNGFKERVEWMSAAPGPGFYYYPEGAAMKETTGKMFFPGTGQIVTGGSSYWEERDIGICHYSLANGLYKRDNGVAFSVSSISILHTASVRCMRLR